MRNNRNESIFLLVGLAVLVLVTGNFFQGLLFAETADRYEDLEWFADAFDKIDTEYVQDLPTDDLIEGAIEGMTASLEDKYSTYLSQDDLRQLEEETSGEYVGVGIKIFMDVRDKLVTVDTTFPGSPAFREGIIPGDRIIRVDDVPTQGMTIDEARDAIRGPRGTTVKLVLWRQEEGSDKGKRIAKTVVRDKIDVKSVLAAKQVATGIGYARIADFNEHTVRDLKKELDDMVQDGIHGFVMDLRWNPGGLLRSAVDVSDLFLNKGKPIVSTKGRATGQDVEWSADSEDEYPEIDIVVLINKRSASASEIVAGALRDNGRATLIGTRTYGKGSVQTVIPLKNDTALRLTTAYYYTPNGSRIHEDKGIEPDIEVPFSVEDQVKLINQMMLEQNGAWAKQYAEQREKEHMDEKAYVEQMTEVDLREVADLIYDPETTIESLRAWLNTASEENHNGQPVEDIQLERAIEWLRERKLGTSTNMAQSHAAAVTDRDW